MPVSVLPLVFGAPLRGEWLLEEGCVYLNHGSYGATPKVVLAAQDEWRLRMERQPVRFMGRELRPALRAAADALAQFVGAEGADLAFVENATAGINAVLRSLVLAPGDEVLTTSHVYAAVRKTLAFHCAQAGARLVEVDLPLPLLTADAVTRRVAAALGPRTRLLVADHVASVSAAVLPVAELAGLCRERGVRVLIDGAHAPGMLDLDIPAIGADWYVGNCHKWLCAAKGCGFLWAAKAAQADLHPPVLSHGLGQGWLEEFDWPGTRDFSAWLAVTAALDFHRRLGGSRLRERNRQVALAAAQSLAACWGTGISAAPDLTGSMACVALPGSGSEDPARLHDYLWDEHRIELPIMPFGGRLWARLSVQAYNESEEYVRLGQVVANAMRDNAGFPL